MPDPAVLSDAVFGRNTRYHFNYIPRGQPEKYGFFWLYQAGDLFATKGYRISQHIQICHEVSYIESGSGQFNINGKWFPVKSGDLIVGRRGDTHDGASDDENPLRIFNLGFEFDDAACREAPYAALRALFEQGVMNQRLVRDCKKTAPFFVGLFQELINRGAFFEDYIAAYATQLLLTLPRAFSGEHPALYHPKRDDVDPDAQLIYKIVNYIDANVEKIDNLSDLAVELRYSYSHLAHVFKRHYGISIYQFYDKKRFERAMELLRAKQMTVTEVAERLNYQSLHAFSKAFKKRFGVSPTEYMALFRAC